jgi:hypothetical protein
MVTAERKGARTRVARFPAHLVTPALPRAARSIRYGTSTPRSHPHLTRVKRMLPRRPQSNYDLDETLE